MAAHKVRVALQGHAPFSAAVQAVYNTLKALREGTKPGELTGIAPPELMQRVTRAADYRQWTKGFSLADRTASPSSPGLRGRRSQPHDVNRV